MIRISLIGAGNIKYHYSELLKINQEELNKHAEAIAEALVQTKAETILLPDRGICFEIAKKIRKKSQNKIYGTVPKSDKDFGITHLQPYITAETDKKKIFDQIIDTNNWYKQDLTHCIFGDIILMLGNSLGAQGELVYGYYLYKLFMGEDKPEVKVMKKKIHPEIRAGEQIPFSVIIYKPFLKEKLNYEIEAYIKKLKGNIYYVNNAAELKTQILNLSNH